MCDKIKWKSSELKSNEDLIQCRRYITLEVGVEDFRWYKRDSMVLYINALL